MSKLTKRRLMKNLKYKSLFKAVMMRNRTMRVERGKKISTFCRQISQAKSLCLRERLFTTRVSFSQLLILFCEFTFL